MSAATHLAFPFSFVFFNISRCTLCMHLGISQGYISHILQEKTNTDFLMFRVVWWMPNLYTENWLSLAGIYWCGLKIKRCLWFVWETVLLLHIKCCFLITQLQEFAFCSMKLCLASWPCLAVKNERKHFCMQNIVLVLLCKVVLANSKPIIFRRFVLGAWNKLDNAKCVVALM